MKQSPKSLEQVMKSAYGKAMVCSRGESPTHQTNQMNLFKTLAATATVITFCLSNANLAKARNGWVYVGENTVGTKSYVRVIGRKGGMVKYQSRLIKTDASGMNDHMLVLADCRNQRIKILEGVHDGKKKMIPSKYKAWMDVMPGMALLDDLNTACF